MAKIKETTNMTLKTFFEEDPVTKVYHRYRTEFHEIKVTENAIESYITKIQKKDKNDIPKYNPAEQHLKKVEFIIKKTKPLKQKFTGEEWESSIKSLLKKIFKEDFDRDNSLPDIESSGVEATA